MKKLISVMVFGLSSLAAQAQLVTALTENSSNSFTRGESTESSKEKDVKSNIDLQYNVLQLDETTLNGVSLGYSVGKYNPNEMYYGFGLYLRYGFGENDNDIKYSLWSLKLPINFGYNIRLTDEITLTPYTGIYFQGNLSATAKNDDADIDMDLLEDGDWKEFVMGWNIGARLSLSRCTIGFAYFTDFMEYCKKGEKKWHGFDVTLGIKF